MKKGDRKSFTIIFIRLAGEEPTSENIEKYKKILWYSIREKHKGGLRLSDDGFDFLKEQNLESYKITLPENTNFTSQSLLMLDNYLDCPYYITKKHIYLYSQKRALEFMLIAGDIEKYGTTKAITKRKNIQKKNIKK